MLKITSYIQHAILIFLIMVAIGSCGDNMTPPVDNGDLTTIVYDPSPYPITQPSYYPQMVIPADNPLTKEGVQLGRFLFYDPILSADSTMSCASCHKPELSFTDGGATSKGIDGIFGTRSSMNLINIGYTKGNFFWDGRANSLEEQAARPVVDPIELHNDWGNIEAKLKKHKNYPAMFRKAFGIVNKSEISQDLATKAIAQFERILISADSKYDKYKRGEVFLNDEEYIGYSLYFDVFGDGIPDGQCNHCHHLELAAGDGFFNNGLQEATLLQDFKDLGKGKITGNISDNGKFRAPTLRNIMLTAPYMHDGSIATIDQVLAHYVSGGKKSPNRDPLLVDKQLAGLDGYYISCLKAFLQTLTDTTSLKNPDFTNPY